MIFSINRSACTPLIILNFEVICSFGLRKLFNLDYFYCNIYSRRKYPRWAQDTDWPFSATGKPLKYIGRKRDGDLVLYIFMDVDTQEIVTVEEYY